MNKPKDNQPRRTWSIAEVSDQLGVPQDTVRGWVRSGVVPSVRIGGRRLIRAEDLAAVLSRSENEGLSNAISTKASNDALPRNEAEPE